MHEPPPPHQELGIGPLFTPTNNAGFVCYQGGAVEFQCDQCGYIGRAAHFCSGRKQIEFKGPLASDKQSPSDIQLRVHRNMGKKEPVEVRAKKWMAQYPQVYAAFVQAAFAEAEFTKRGSAKFIAECLRRRRDLVAGKPFKIPNAHVTYMALRFMEEHPVHAGLFKTTKRK